jgi:hypothetical protein
LICGDGFNRLPEALQRTHAPKLGKAEKAISTEIAFAKVAGL